ncbi:Sucrase/ferredoxin-like-domain-containing protein [Flagelloscypha sp. PMI_526]|nr:Sucrase/ferredoxin-like-domain-containing protein [Flagelloscypha sp. PMI_526]
MQSTLRKLLSTVLLQETGVDAITNELKGAAVPVSTDPCRSCEDPCTEGHDQYPARLNIDLETRLLGTVNPYRRQVVISTGKSDWPAEIAWERSSLAWHLSSALFSIPSGSTTSLQGTRVSGIWRHTESSTISLLNGSHRSLSDHDDKETVLVFPDYTLVTEVPRSADGAKLLCSSSIGPTIQDGGMRTFILPYSVVILLCSHKRRDNRCAIAAPKLENQFRESLEQREWVVDTQIDEHELGPSLESISDRKTHLSTRLQNLAGEKRALILKISHIGGHKYSGVVNLYLPKGCGVWYGRVTTHDVESIVVNTIEGGKILPALLRGGVNLTQSEGKTMLDW